MLFRSEAQADGTYLATHVHLLPVAATPVAAPDASAAPATNG